jgi:hypothetical protein
MLDADQNLRGPLQTGPQAGNVDHRPAPSIEREKKTARTSPACRYSYSPSISLPV